MSDSPSTAGRWDEVLRIIESQVNRQQFETWFRKVQPLSVNPDLVRLSVPDAFLRDWLRDYYQNTIHEALRTVLGGDVGLDIIVVPSSEAASEPFEEPPSEIHTNQPAWAAVPSQADQSGLRRNANYPNFLSDVLLNDRYVFDNFVVGRANQLPHAAAVAVAEKPALAYNPLFLHGSVGLGKTHLLQAICHTLLSCRKDMKILYLSCECFTNHFIAAVKSGDLGSFRNRYRRADMLLIDDINFLARKEQTQEEFFHTFNALYNSGKQIVLSSDSSPKEIPTLEDRLVSRFKWGLVAELDPPDFETRVLIVKRKARLRNQQLPDDVSDFIADRITANIRELEGAVLKVLSVADLHKKPVDLPMVKDALRPLLAPARRKVTMERIISEVTSYFEVRLADLQSKKRSRSIAFPRQVCMFLARRLTDHSLEEIGGYFGGRDHTTVIYAADKISKLWTKDRRFKQEVEALIQEIEG